MSMTADEFLQRRKEGTLPHLAIVCKICKRSITGVPPEEMKTIDGKPVHDDCYFEKISMMIKKQPVGFRQPTAA